MVISEFHYISKENLADKLTVLTLLCVWITSQF